MHCRQQRGNQTCSRWAGRGWRLLAGEALGLDRFDEFRDTGLLVIRHEGKHEQHMYQVLSDICP